MPHRAKSHHDFCGSLCLMCLKKGPQLRTISSGTKGPVRTHDYPGYIKQLWWADYDCTDSRLPRMICMNCRLKLINHSDHPDNPDPLPPRIKYEEIILRPDTRQSRPCDCDICLSGRFTFKEVEPVPACTIKAAGEAKKVNRKRRRESANRCQKCHQIIGRGIKHPCTKSDEQINLDELVKNTSDKSKSKVLAGGGILSFDQYLKIFVSANLSDISQAAGGSKELTLTTFGRNPLTVSLSKPSLPKVPYSKQDLVNLQTKLKLSDRAVR